MQVYGKQANDMNKRTEASSSAVLQQEIEKLRLELNTLKLKEVSTQQSEFNTAKEHKEKE